ncbi:MAG: hypothetical protein GX127_00040 [Eubacteriaceae bacterium]|jgi:hypothetical protein|nr:hypothetical protein [Eubacteriaceae bacterium]
MTNEVAKAILGKLEKTNYSTGGLGTIDLSEYSNVDEVKAALEELKALNDYKEVKFDLNEGEMKLSVYNPEEDIDAFEARNPSRQSCGGYNN